jgi:hypothetical protein
MALALALAVAEVGGSARAVAAIGEFLTLFRKQKTKITIAFQPRILTYQSTTKNA